MDLDFDDLDLAEADAAPGIPGADDVYVINLERRATVLPSSTNGGPSRGLA